MNTFVQHVLAYLTAEKSRAVSVAFLLAVPVWMLLIAPQLLKIPSSFSYTADVVSVDNFYDASRDEYAGEQYSQTIFSYDVVSKKGSNLEIKNTFRVESLDGKLIFETAPVYGINAYTGAHQSGFGDRDRHGYLFAPRGIARGESFTYWHVSGNAPSTMRYVGEERLYGLTVYKYAKANIEEIDQTELMGFLPGVPERRGVKLASEVNLWVEPVSGYAVKIEDFSTDYYFFDSKSGERLEPYNKFRNTYTEESVKHHAAIARGQKQKILFVAWVVPGVLVLVALLIQLIQLPFLRAARVFCSRNRLAVLIFVVSIFASVAAATIVARDFERQRNEALASDSEELLALIQHRIDPYLNALLGARALFDASSAVSRSEWSTYVSSLAFDTRYPGVQAIGFSEVVDPASKESFIASVRNSGLSTFTITPPGEREVYTSILYVEPMNARNKRAIGYDMFSEVTRRSAMTRARDTGDAAASGKVTLVQETGADVQAGFLLYVPVYRTKSVPSTLKGRRENILGYVYAAFRANDLLTNVDTQAPHDLDFHVYDGLVASADTELYHHVHDQENLFETVYRKQSVIYIAGRAWIVEFSKQAAPWGSVSDFLVVLGTLFGGLIAGVLVFALVLSITNAKYKAVAYGEALTVKLREGERALEAENEKLNAKLLELDKINRLTVDRELKMIELKKQIRTQTPP